MDLHAGTWVTKSGYEWRPDARRFEKWETKSATKVGLGFAVNYALGWGLPAEEIERFCGEVRLLRTQ